MRCASFRCLALAVAIAAGFAIAGAAAATPLHAVLGAPDNLVITGTFRSRFEAIDNQFRPLAAKSDQLLSLRTTLFAEYRTGPVRIGAEIMDARGYLQDRLSSAGTTEINALELTQAYVAVEFGELLGPASASRLLAGRFTLDLGSRRLVARANFRNSTNAFTGVRLEWRGPGAAAVTDSALLFWALPHTRLPRDPDGIRANAVEFDRESLDVQLFGASFTKASVLGGTAQLYSLGLLERDAPGFPTANRRLYTAGLRLFRPPQRGHFDHDFEAAYQLGTTRATILATDATVLDVAAHFVHAEAGYSFAATWSPRLVLQYDLASGDDDDPRSFNRFDTLFGARRWEFGPTGLFGAVNRSNLNAPGLRLEATPDARWDGFVGWRPLWLASATDSFAATGVRDRSGALGRFAGHQVEGRVRYWLVPRLVRLDTGFAVLAKGAFLRDAPNARDNGDTRYGYFEANFNF
jgi:hypothetical protein